MTCHVVNRGCEGYPVHTKCFACGEAVCRNCSVIRSWYRYNRKRVCATCDEDERNNAERRVKLCQQAVLSAALHLKHKADRVSWLRREERELVARLFNVRAELRKQK